MAPALSLILAAATETLALSLNPVCFECLHPTAFRRLMWTTNGKEVGMKMVLQEEIAILLLGMGIGIGQDPGRVIVSWGSTGSGL
mmetsp:Transcript_150422/g.262836  ORF Transcript_150422/g.262836 Transcript_150422/m.262836 type:complete len:85 (-) Transcript_150422:1606-1860(-)